MKFQCRSKYDTEHDLVQEFIKYSVNNFNDNSKRGRAAQRPPKYVTEINCI